VGASISAVRNPLSQGGGAEDRTERIDTADDFVARPDQKRDAGDQVNRRSDSSMGGSGRLQGGGDQED
jgi:hypothetical protein